MTTQEQHPDALEVQPAEAGFSLNWTMRDRDGAAVQVTMRGARATDWPSIIHARAAFLERATAGGWSFAPQASPAAQPAPQASAPAPAANGGSVPPAPAGEAVSVDVARMEVKPEVDDKVTVLFYSKGHQYPDVRATKWKITRAREVFGALTGHDWTKPGDFAVAWRIWYTIGKEYEPGKRYKDIQRAEPIN